MEEGKTLEIVISNITINEAYELTKAITEKLKEHCVDYSYNFNIAIRIE